MRRGRGPDQEGVTALAGYGGIFRRNALASRSSRKISVILGPCAGGAAYSPALTDFVFMVRDMAQMFITGPDVVQAVTGEQISMNGLGGADVHAGVSGVSSFVYDDEYSCLADVRYLLSLLPANNRSLPPVVPCADPVDRRTDALLDLVPSVPTQAYDILRVIEEIVDDGEYFEVQPNWARNIVCALARMGGRLVGVVANQPMVSAGDPGHRRVRQGRALHPDVRLLQHPAGHPRRRTRLPAGPGAGAPGDHQTRREGCSTPTASPPSPASS